MNTLLLDYDAYWTLEDIPLGIALTMSEDVSDNQAVILLSVSKRLYVPNNVMRSAQSKMTRPAEAAQNDAPQIHEKTYARSTLVVVGRR